MFGISVPEVGCRYRHLHCAADRTMCEGQEGSAVRGAEETFDESSVEAAVLRGATDQAVQQEGREAVAWRAVRVQAVSQEGTAAAVLREVIAAMASPEVIAEAASPEVMAGVVS